MLESGKMLIKFETFATNQEVVQALQICCNILHLFAGHLPFNYCSFFWLSHLGALQLLEVSLADDHTWPAAPDKTF